MNPDDETGVCRPASTPAGIGPLDVAWPPPCVSLLPRLMIVPLLEFELLLLWVADVPPALDDGFVTGLDALEEDELDEEDEDELEEDEDDELEDELDDDELDEDAALDELGAVTGLQPLFQIACPAAFQFSEYVFPLYVNGGMMSPHLGSFGCPGYQTVPVCSVCPAWITADGAIVIWTYGFVSESVRWHSVTLSDAAVWCRFDAAAPDVDTTMIAPAAAVTPATASESCRPFDQPRASARVRLCSAIVCPHFMPCGDRSGRRRSPPRPYLEPPVGGVVRRACTPSAR